MKSSDAVVVAKRKAFDGVTILFWSDGAVTDRNGKYIKGRLPKDRIFEFAGNVCLYTYDEIPEAIAAFKQSKRNPMGVLGALAGPTIVGAIGVGTIIYAAARK
jgi:hypothetical protein